MLLLYFSILVINFTFVNGGCSDVSIMSRSEWNARTPRRTRTLRTPVSKVFVHHTGTNTCSSNATCSSRVKRIQHFHMITRRWHDIGYNFLVGEDGNVYEGRGWDHIGSHVRGQNSRSLGVAMIGQFGSRLPNSKALTAIQNLLQCGIELNKLRPNYRLYGHRDSSRTSCPGNKLYANINTWPRYHRNKS